MDQRRCLPTFGIEPYDITPRDALWLKRYSAQRSQIALDNRFQFDSSQSNTSEKTWDAFPAFKIGSRISPRKGGWDNRHMLPDTPQLEDTPTN